MRTDQEMDAAMADEAGQAQRDAVRNLGLIIEFAHQCVLDDDLWAAFCKKVVAQHDEFVKARGGEVPAEGPEAEAKAAADARQGKDARLRLHSVIDMEGFSLMIAGAIMNGAGRQGPQMRVMGMPGPAFAAERLAAEAEPDGERPMQGGIL